MDIRDIMTPYSELATARRTDLITDVARKMKENDTGVIPVVDEIDTKSLVGVITDRDIAVRVVAAGIDPATARVSEFMTEDPECLTSDADIKEASETMADLQVHRLPVVDDGNLVGIVSLGDIAVAKEKQGGRALEGISEGAKAEGRVH